MYRKKTLLIIKLICDLIGFILKTNIMYDQVVVLKLTVAAKT